jgi:hypothetical protein
MCCLVRLQFFLQLADVDRFTKSNIDFFLRSSGFCDPGFLVSFRLFQDFVETCGILHHGFHFVLVEVHSTELLGWRALSSFGLLGLHFWAAASSGLGLGKFHRELETICFAHAVLVLRHVRLRL